MAQGLTALRVPLWRSLSLGHNAKLDRLSARACGSLLWVGTPSHSCRLNFSCRRRAISTLARPPVRMAPP